MDTLTQLNLFPDHIEKARVAILPPCDIKGDIVLIDRADDVPSAIRRLRQSDVIGFDTETKPSFKRGISYGVSLLQLADRTTCYLFRLNKLGPNAELRDYLEDGSQIKIGLSVQDDFRSLSRWMPVRPQNFIELQKYVRAFGIEEMSLQKTYAIIFRQKISKRQQLSNWEAQTLTPAQMLYAATDAWACLRIYLELQRRIHGQ